MNKTLTLSIVIPVYNEQNHIKPCLNAIARQSVAPAEVIIVDNNSTDKTVEIAERYPFVRVIREPKQGRAHARAAGFNAAKTDIIGRIDADSQITPDWVERVLADFSADPGLSGLTGLGITYFIPWRLPNIWLKFASRVYFWSTYCDLRVQTMWGANSALKREAWIKVRARADTEDKDVHEDIDLSLLMVIAGMRIGLDKKLLIKTKGISYNYLPKMLKYYRMRFANKKLRYKELFGPGNKVKKIPLWQVQWFRLITLLPLLVFMAGSVVWFPLDWYMVNIARRRHWPD